MAEHPAKGNSGNLLGGSTWLLRKGSAGEHGAEDTCTSGQQTGLLGKSFLLKPNARWHSIWPAKGGEECPELTIGEKDTRTVMDGLPKGALDQHSFTQRENLHGRRFSPRSQQGESGGWAGRGGAQDAAPTPHRAALRARS